MTSDDISRDQMRIGHYTALVVSKCIPSRGRGKEGEMRGDVGDSGNIEACHPDRC